MSYHYLGKAESSSDGSITKGPVNIFVPCRIVPGVFK